MRRRLSLTDGIPLAPAFAAIRAEEGVPEAFTSAVLAEAETAARSPRLPAENLTHVPFVTLDPPTSMDLDQAFHLERLPADGARGGFRVRYAIADVAAFVSPGGALAAEADRRVVTIYCPDRRVTLYPPVLSEGAASLLPDGPRPAVVWTIDIDADGLTTAVDVRRAMVRSRAKLDYAGVQATIDAGTAEGPVALLRQVGETLIAAEHARGGMSMRVPTQEVATEPDGRSVLRFRRPLPAEDWNAQLSLLTGRAAASLMLGARTGILRTMPAADPRDVERLRRVAAGLGIEWPSDVSYGALVTAMDADTPQRAAFLNEAGSLFRGAGYTAFAGSLPELTTHAAIAAPYAHCTAPLRRLVDRTVSETCLAIAAGRAVPAETEAALPLLPTTMAEGTRRAGRVERASIDLVESAVLAPHVGERFDAVVVALDDDGDGGEIALPDLAVIARCAGRLPLGHRAQVVLDAADPATRTLRFRLAADTAGEDASTRGVGTAGGSGTAAGRHGRRVRRVSRRWDAGSYDRVSDPMVRMGGNVLARLELRGDETVIDAGCGTGRITEQLLERLPDGQVIALDVSPAMLVEAAGRLARFGDRVTLLEADLNLPLPVAEPADAIFSTATFHWVLAQEALPGHLAAALKPDGRLVAQCGGEGNNARVFAAMEAEGERPMERLRFAGPDLARRRLAGAGFIDVEAWLTPEPVGFDTRAEMETYLATVFLGPLTDRPASELPALARAVAERLPEPVLDYVRLNLVARRG